MNKMFFLVLTLMVLGAASMNGQVTVGANRNPATGAVLDLEGTQGALLLPRVDTLRSAPLATPVAGMQVYRPADNTVYVFDGTKWRAASGVSAGAPVIITQPKAFSWSRLRDTNGDPNGPSAAQATTNIGKLTVLATGAGLQYQWYQKAVNPNAPDIKLTSATTNEYTFTVADVNVAHWGLYSFYCVVSNEFGSVTSNVADIALGCGAKTATGAWLKFQCYNLGVPVVAYSRDPFSYSASDTTMLGKFYQWGRPNPANRVNNSNNWTNATAYPYDWNIPNGYSDKSPLSNTYHQDDLLWRNHKNGANDPCPDGWHVPAQTAFGVIFKGTADADVSANATANTWTATGSFVDVTGNGGYTVKPDGVTTTLFFPAAGYRYFSIGALYYVGFNGYYWSSTTAGAGAYYLGIDSGRVYPSRINYRGNGFSVRCISE
jgi:uncharacterized protein (TIGR02145 family)